MKPGWTVSSGTNKAILVRNSERGGIALIGTAVNRLGILVELLDSGVQRRDSHCVPI